MSDVDNKVNLKDFLLLIYKNLSDFLVREEVENYSELKLQELTQVSGSIDILLELAYQKKDIELAEILEDFENAYNQLGFVNFKAEAALKEAKSAIDNYK